MQNKLNDLVIELNKVGLKLNGTKTKEMRTNTTTMEQLNLLVRHTLKVVAPKTVEPRSTLRAG